VIGTLALAASLVGAAPLAAQDGPALPGEVVAAIEQKATQLDADHLRDLPASSRRGVITSYVLSRFAQAAELPGFDEKLLSPTRRTQADRVIEAVLGGVPPTPPEPEPAPEPAPVPAPAPRRAPTPRPAPMILVPPAPLPAPVLYIVPQAPTTWVPVAPTWVVAPSRPHPWWGWGAHHRGR
jgi:hypothetical protein